MSDPDDASKNIDDSFRIIMNYSNNALQTLEDYVQMRKTKLVEGIQADEARIKAEEAAHNIGKTTEEIQAELEKINAQLAQMIASDEHIFDDDDAGQHKGGRRSYKKRCSYKKRRTHRRKSYRKSRSHRKRR